MWVGKQGSELVIYVSKNGKFPAGANAVALFKQLLLLILAIGEFSIRQREGAKEAHLGLSLPVKDTSQILDFLYRRFQPKWEQFVELAAKCDIPHVNNPLEKVRLAIIDKVGMGFEYDLAQQATMYTTTNGNLEEKDLLLQVGGMDKHVISLRNIAYRAKLLRDKITKEKQEPPEDPTPETKYEVTDQEDQKPQELLGEVIDPRLYVELSPLRSIFLYTPEETWRGVSLQETYDTFVQLVALCAIFKHVQLLSNKNADPQFAWTMPMNEATFIHQVSQILDHPDSATKWHDVCERYHIQPGVFMTTLLALIKDSIIKCADTLAKMESIQINFVPDSTFNYTQLQFQGINENMGEKYTDTIAIEAVLQMMKHIADKMASATWPSDALRYHRDDVIYLTSTKWTKNYQVEMPDYDLAKLVLIYLCNRTDARFQVLGHLDSMDGKQVINLDDLDTTLLSVVADPGYSTLVGSIDNILMIPSKVERQLTLMAIMSIIREKCELDRYLRSGNPRITFSMQDIPPRIWYDHRPYAQHHDFYEVIGVVRNLLPEVLGKYVTTVTDDVPLTPVRQPLYRVGDKIHFKFYDGGRYSLLPIVVVGVFDRTQWVADVPRYTVQINLNLPDNKIQQVIIVEEHQLVEVK